MILFVRNIPDNAKTKDLKDFVEPAFQPPLFFLPKRGRVLKAEIMALQNVHNKLVEHHGLVFLDSKLALQLALSKLRGKRFKNRSLQIREYKFRSIKNDRRKFASTHGLFENQRLHDRRRGSSMQVIETLSTMTLVS